MIAPKILEMNKIATMNKHTENSLIPDYSCSIAIPYYISNEDEKSSSFTFILSDLSVDYSDGEHSYGGLNLKQTQQAISWLAAFHAFFYHESRHNLKSTTSFYSKNNQYQKRYKNVWSEGGYWHLNTRLDELEDIPSSQKIFYTSAHAINQRMNQNPSSLTIIHGDFKSANILFGTNQCAVVDFQYCGYGYGVKDLVMLIVSSVSSRVLDEVGEDKLLQLYANALKHNLHVINRLSSQDVNGDTNHNINHDYSFAEISDELKIKSQYELALVDYMRFMAGWGIWGTNSDYAEERASKILETIYSSWSRSENHKSACDLAQKDWTEAINEFYPIHLF